MSCSKCCPVASAQPTCLCHAAGCFPAGSTNPEGSTHPGFENHSDSKRFEIKSASLVRRSARLPRRGRPGLAAQARHHPQALRSRDRRDGRDDAFSLQENTFPCRGCVGRLVASTAHSLPGCGCFDRLAPVPVDATVFCQRSSPQLHPRICRHIVLLGWSGTEGEGEARQERAGGGGGGGGGRRRQENLPPQGARAPQQPGFSRRYFLDGYSSFRTRARYG